MCLLSTTWGGASTTPVQSAASRLAMGACVPASIRRLSPRPPQMFEGMTAHLFRRARLPLDPACWQAGVDLGSVVREHEAAARAARKGAAGRKGSRGRDRTAALVGAAAGPQIRPKRRMPVSKVRAPAGAGVRQRPAAAAHALPARWLGGLGRRLAASHRSANAPHRPIPSPALHPLLCPAPGAAGGRRHAHARHRPLCAQHDGPGGGGDGGGPGPGEGGCGAHGWGGVGWGACIWVPRTRAAQLRGIPGWPGTRLQQLMPLIAGRLGQVLLRQGGTPPLERSGHTHPPRCPPRCPAPLLRRRWRWARRCRRGCTRARSAS